MDEKTLSIGVDVGGSHIACAVVNIECGELLPNTLTRVDVDSMGRADKILSAWAKALNETMTHIDSSCLAGIGFAMPGPFDYRNGISKMEQKFTADVIVLGGNISGAYDLFSPALKKSLESVYPDAAVEVSLLGENAAMMGAARLLDDNFWKQASMQLPGI